MHAAKRELACQDHDARATYHLQLYYGARYAALAKGPRGRWPDPLDLQRTAKHELDTGGGVVLDCSYDICAPCLALMLERGRPGAPA